MFIRGLRYGIATVILTFIVHVLANSNRNVVDYYLAPIEIVILGRLLNIDANNKTRILGNCNVEFLQIWIEWRFKYLQYTIRT
jgi:hypothetical protein